MRRRVKLRTAHGASRLRRTTFVVLQLPAQPRRAGTDVIRPNRLDVIWWSLSPRRQMPPGLVRPLPIVMEPPFPADVIQVPLGHNHERVQAFELQALYEPFDVRPQVRGQLTGGSGENQRKSEFFSPLKGREEYPARVTAHGSGERFGTIAQTDSTAAVQPLHPRQTLARHIARLCTAVNPLGAIQLRSNKRPAG